MIKKKTVNLPIIVPESDYCWEYGADSVCQYFSNEDIHNTCVLNLGVQENTVVGVAKPHECITLHAVEEYPNVPPKEIQNAIWGSCFDNEDFDTTINDIEVRDRVYQCWQLIHHIVKQNPDAFISTITKTQPDIREWQ